MRISFSRAIEPFTQKGSIQSEKIISALKGDSLAFSIETGEISIECMEDELVYCIRNISTTLPKVLDYIPTLP